MQEKNIIENNKDNSLFVEIKNLINSAKTHVAKEVNSTMTALYWEIGNYINKDFLENKRAEYGNKTIKDLSLKLQKEYGTSSYSEKNLRRMMQFASVFPNREIVVSLIRQFSWTHIIAFVPIQDELKREFYMQMCRIENWSKEKIHKKCFL